MGAWARMKQSVIIPLSPQEEDTLRLIAHGLTNAQHLPADHLEQLVKLRLVDQDGRKVMLSDLGQLRLTQSQELRFLSIIRAARPRPAGPIV
jgi:predicted transcriptional regulator